MYCIGTDSNPASEARAALYVYVHVPLHLSRRRITYAKGLSSLSTALDYSLAGFIACSPSHRTRYSILQMNDLIHMTVKNQERVKLFVCYVA